MISLDLAIKTRWDAVGLSAIAGPYFGQLPEQFMGTFPYCIYSHISNVTIGRTPAHRYSDMQVQFQIYDVDNLLVGNECELVKGKFLSSDRAATNPLQASNLGIVDVRLVNNPIMLQESDGVVSGTMVFGIQYAEEAGLTPA